MAQNPQTSLLDIILAVTVEDKDYVYVCLGNSNSDTSWKNNPNWVSAPYDDPRYPNLVPTVCNLFIAHTKGQELFMVVDISRKPMDGTDFLYRYFLDPSGKVTGKKWNPNDIGANLNVDVQSVLGRKKRERVDGIYTLGSVNGKGEVIYMPLYNAYVSHVSLH